jgi:hypothetical protein
MGAWNGLAWKSRPLIGLSPCPTSFFFLFVPGYLQHHDRLHRVPLPRLARKPGHANARSPSM